MNAIDERDLSWELDDLLGMLEDPSSCSQEEIKQQYRKLKNMAAQNETKKRHSGIEGERV